MNPRTVGKEWEQRLQKRAMSATWWNKGKGKEGWRSQAPSQDSPIFDLI